MMEYISTYTAFNENKLNKWQAIGMLTLGIMIIADYVLTYLGIYEFHMITEGNPNMVWLMDLPFSQGIMIRLLFVVLIEVGMYIVLTSNKVDLFEDHKTGEFKEKKTNISYGNMALIAGLAINMVPLILHVLWLYAYEYMVWDIPGDIEMTVGNILLHMFTGTM